MKKITSEIKFEIEYKTMGGWSKKILTCPVEGFIEVIFKDRKKGIVTEETQETILKEYRANTGKKTSFGVFNFKYLSTSLVIPYELKEPKTFKKTYYKY